MNNTVLTADVTSKVNLVKSIANKTRGPYTPENYGRVIIPMAIIRRFDCILASKNKAIRGLLELTASNKQLKPEQIEKLVEKQCGVPFYNAKCVSLEDLVGESDNLNSNFQEFIGAYSPSIQRILQGLKFREEVEFMIKKGILFEVVKAFSEVDFHPSTTSPMAMGYIFEEIIRTYKANAEAGDHYTPREVIELCVELLMSDNVEGLKKEGKIIRAYDCCCGTGGMLTTLKRKLTDPEEGLGIKPENIRLYGQDVNPEAYAICQAEMLMLNENPANVREGNTLTEDRFPGEKFDLLITNPPFGVEWKTEKAAVEKELKQPNNRFVAGTPRVSDGQLLFLQNLLAKAEDDARIAIILNGSPLLYGDAGSGESEIRRYVLNNHMLEAIIALPDQMFYNTPILTYIWILSKTPNAHRNKKIQLIDATKMYVPQLPKSLGNKRKFIDAANRKAIVAEYQSGKPSEISKLFVTEDFGYTKVTMERPLYDEKGNKVYKRGVLQVNSSCRDSEIIPLNRDIDSFIQMEVLPYVPDAFPDRSKDKIGYEIPFARYFYTYTPPRSSKAILNEIKEKEEMNSLLKERRQSLIYEAVTKGLDSMCAMKDSGIDWLGNIPENWNVVSLKRLGTPETGATPSKANSDYWDGVIPWVSAKDMKSDYLTDSEDHITKEAVIETGLKLFPRNTVIFCVRSGILRHTFPVCIATVPVTINQDLRAMVLPDEIESAYLLYYLRGINDIIISLYQKTGATVESIEMNWLMYLPVVIPPKDEQKRIIARLKENCASIDNAIDANERTITRLKELRQSLIFEAVTGKNEVKHV